MAAGALLPLGVAAAPAFLALGDLPLCAFKHLTGVDCPLCGGIRTCAALAQGDFYAAWQTNPGLLPLLALAARVVREVSGLLRLATKTGRGYGDLSCLRDLTGDAVQISLTEPAPLAGSQIIGQAQRADL